MDASSSDALFVAPDLDHFESPSPVVFADDVVISDRCFRRLDPAYFAWLRHRMQIAKRAADTGRLSPRAFAELRRRFAEVHGWALRCFGEDTLRAAVRAFDPRTYEPPSIDDDGLPGVFAPLRPRTPTGSNGRQTLSARTT